MEENMVRSVIWSQVAMSLLLMYAGMHYDVLIWQTLQRSVGSFLSF